ncbi:ArnT family glycosyltransferase [Neobacillus massiliamazoniensis]|jgi:4-amino-4-deoxy-L-arabinose transferase-like glycosyltransferase|uniref:Undecaprenyl phosphate-alpha-4-amino-4-deoxy-L-arabinose arabinosyl transferase n=1 Tax=Neobacillus massiliamazoniensis TaxID=1499688 RepID=A0A0U1P533_9BACI|nr:glycosyltransferase family 39 protein [Neobacillus massiliamazoniensis]CRK85425.1 Undecaprenyl phosphate-alpha-4-amino-4-deoxy-L-arabinose arabinosyl transferase [Neobacillus massiliamazoniensis]
MYGLCQRYYPIFLTVLLVLASYNIFYSLGTFPISSWDEARHGVSAYEMLKKGNFLVNTYLNQIDYWNLKPPLSFWANMAGYKIAGYNTLGLRLFSAISAILTIIFVAVFVNLKHGKLASLISTLTLATCTQFLTDHSARTGDADALFVFFFTTAILSLLLFKEKPIFLYMSGFAFALAFLTKSWHAGNIAAIICLYLLLTGSYKKLTYINWILLFTFMFAPIFAWACIRYQYDGMEFFNNMIAYDLLKRSSNAIEGHIGGYSYYFLTLWNYFSFWLLLLIGLVLLYPFRELSISKLKAEKATYYLGLCLWIIVPILFFTFAKTKIRWYILPVYPTLSVIIGALSSKILLNGKTATRAALLFSILVVSLFHEWEIQTYLGNPPSKLHIRLIQNVQKIDDLKGYSLFVHNPKSPLKWTQNMVLASKLYGDLLIENGDVSDFLKRENALLLLRKGHDSEDIINSNQLTIITSNKWGYIVRKNM